MEYRVKSEWTPPHDWQFTLWERPADGTVGNWSPVCVYTQEFVCKVRDLLSRLQPRFEFTVTRPGSSPIPASRIR